MGPATQLELLKDLKHYVHGVLLHAKHGRSSQADSKEVEAFRTKLYEWSKKQLEKEENKAK